MSARWAVLFLFVVMMLDVDFVELRQGFLQYLPIGALIGLVLLVELVMVFGTWVTAPDGGGVALIPPMGEVSNTRALGLLLYTRYIYFFQAAGLVLLVAMIGAIVLTLRHKEGVQAAVDPGAERPHQGDRHRGAQGRTTERYLTAPRGRRKGI